LIISNIFIFMILYKFTLHLIYFKTFVIECYENDNIIDLFELHRSMKRINVDYDSDN
jgi:hypothetical protein